MRASPRCSAASERCTHAAAPGSWQRGDVSTHPQGVPIHRDDGCVHPFVDRSHRDDVRIHRLRGACSGTMSACIRRVYRYIEPMHGYIASMFRRIEPVCADIGSGGACSGRMQACIRRMDRYIGTRRADIRRCTQATALGCSRRDDACSHSRVESLRNHGQMRICHQLGIFAHPLRKRDNGRRYSGGMSFGHMEARWSSGGGGIEVRPCTGT